MELRPIVQAWDTLVQRLESSTPALGRLLRRACHPIAAERHLDGTLLVVLGCWWPPDLTTLQDAGLREQLAAVVGPMLEDQLAFEVVPWPAGMAPLEAASATEGEPREVPAPDVLVGLPAPARAEARRCESTLQRWFYARAYLRGLRLHCQYVVGHCRLDFALPSYRVAVDVDGWEARRGPREREQQLGAHRWRLVWFGGKEVHRDADGCVTELLRLLAAHARRPARAWPGGYRERR